MSVQWLEVLVYPGSMKAPTAVHMRSLEEQLLHCITVNRLNEQHTLRLYPLTCKQGQHLLTFEKVVRFLVDVHG